MPLSNLASDIILGQASAHSVNVIAVTSGEGFHPLFPFFISVLMLGLLVAGELHERRQIELSGGPAGDEVILSPDRCTVTLNLTSPNKTSDLVRVIVDASIPSPDDRVNQTGRQP